jgi:AAA family ATP:ADP antiporter
MAIELGTHAINQLFTAVFLTMLAIVPLFGWLTRHVPRQRLLPWLYAFFILNLLGFHAVLSHSDRQTAWVANSFFVWVSVFNLFSVSLFWSYMADLFTTAQARRLVGFIAAGGTAGALCGPLLSWLLVKPLGASGLTLVSAALLGLCVLAALKLRTWQADQPGNCPAPRMPDGPDPGEQRTTLHGPLLSGLTDVFKSPYLLGICGFLYAYSLLSTTLYFQQTELVPKAIGSMTGRTELLAQVDLLVNVATLLIQALAFNRLIARMGIRALLVAMPLASLLGYTTLALFTALPVLVTLGVLRRAGEYAISKPARETLFNVLPPEQKYRAKNVIDTLVHRTGDTSSAWLLQGLRSLGFSSAQILWLSVPVCASWLLIAWALGSRAQRLANVQSHERVT